MCKVRDIETCEKKVVIYLWNGEHVSSEWFDDEERKNTFGDDRFTSAEMMRYKNLISENGINEEDIEHWAVQRNKDEADCIYISRHAFDRMRERNGWNKKTALRMIKKVYDTGLNPDEVKGEYRAWIKERAKKHPEVIIKFYGQTLYIFDNRVLVTAIHGNKLKFA